MPRRIARAAFAMAGTFLAACAAKRVLPPDPYAHCLDLGDLSLPSASREDAESWMRSRVRELGGDTLIFSERGRVARAGRTPDEVVRGRDARVGASPKPPATARARSDEPEAVDAGAPGARRRGKVTAQPIEPLLGELWYYGAALRCSPTGGGAFAAAGDAPVPLVRIAPDYPGGASDGADGEVSLEFTIAATGTTKDIVVVASSAPKLEAPAIAALLRWRYPPLVESGASVERRGVRTTIRFGGKRDRA